MSERTLTAPLSTACLYGIAQTSMAATRHHRRTSQWRTADGAPRERHGEREGAHYLISGRPIIVRRTATSPLAARTAARPSAARIDRDDTLFPRRGGSRAAPPSLSVRAYDVGCDARNHAARRLPVRFARRSRAACTHSRARLFYFEAFTRALADIVEGFRSAAALHGLSRTGEREGERTNGTVESTSPDGRSQRCARVPSARRRSMATWERARARARTPRRPAPFRCGALPLRSATVAGEAPRFLLASRLSTPDSRLPTPRLLMSRKEQMSARLD